MMRFPLAFALCLGIAGAQASPLTQFRGHPTSGGGGGGSGAAYACDAGGSGVCADFSDGQTFVQWPDVLDTGVTDYTKRYRAYRATTARNSGNCTSGTKIASYILPNSGQLIGGTPNGSGATYTQANRSSAAQPMAVIPDAQHGGLKTLAYATGLQPYTALATENAYYCVGSTDTSDGSFSYIGAVGPIAESVATPTAKLYAHRTTGYGAVTGSTSGLPVVFSAHASSGQAGGTVSNSAAGDFYEMFGRADEGWQDGQQRVYDVVKDGVSGRAYASFSSGPLAVTNRDAIWYPDGVAVSGVGSMETYHSGIGMSPNSLVGPANRRYETTGNSIARFLNFTISNYGADPNQLYWAGASLGAYGGAYTGIRMTSPRISALSLMHPNWRWDHLSSAKWPGIWPRVTPFVATVAAPFSTLGTIATNVLMADGTRWGGDGGYADIPAFIAAAPGSDIPVAMWKDTKDDGNVLWADDIAAMAAFQSAKRGHVFVFSHGGHETALGGGVMDCDLGGADSSVCYHKTDFKLNVPYPATSNSSIDDDPGTATRLANGVFDGDDNGGINLGFKWSFTADTSSNAAFTISNAYMGRTPTPHATTTAGTMASSGSGSVTVADGTQFAALTGGANTYFLIGNTVSDQEAVLVTSVVGNTVTFASRAQLGSTAKAHAFGVAIRQFISQPTAPNGGPYASMTVDITPRRLQAFLPANTTAPTCTITPFGESPVTQTPTVANGLFTLVAVKINVGGNTSVSCVP